MASTHWRCSISATATVLGGGPAETRCGSDHVKGAPAFMTPPVAGGPSAKFIGHQAVRCSASRDVAGRGHSAVTRRAGPPFQAPLVPSWGYQHHGLKAAKALPEGASEGPVSKAEGEAMRVLALAMDATILLQQIDAHKSMLATEMAARAEQGINVLDFITLAYDELTTMERASEGGLEYLAREQGLPLEELKSFVASAVELADLVCNFFEAASGEVPEQLLKEIVSFAALGRNAFGNDGSSEAKKSGGVSWPSEPARATAQKLLAAEGSTVIPQLDHLVIVVEQCNSTVTSLKDGLEDVRAVFSEEKPAFTGGFQPEVRGAAHLKAVVPAQDTHKVYFATDRKPKGKKDGVLAYSWEQQDKLETGWTDVSVSLKSQDGWMSQDGSPPAYHIVLLEDCNELFEPDDAGLQADFYGSLKQEVDAHKGELLLCIHGYSVSFNDAIRGAAQLAYNLKHEEGGYGGAVLAYDWASCGATWRYGFLPDNVDNDLKRAESSANRLAEILEGLAKYVLPGPQGANSKKLHIVAHSMGNFVLKKALDNLKEKTAQLHAFRSVTRTVTFAAPNVGRNDFKEMVNLLVPSTGNQQLVATLVCSNGDLVLLASSLLRIMLDPKNRGYRAGLFRAWRFAGGHRVHPLLLPFRLDTVDASGFANDTFGHGYFANSRSLLAEISHIINSGQRARGRMALAPPPILEVNQSPCFACQGKWFQVRRTVAIKR